MKTYKTFYAEKGRPENCDVGRTVTLFQREIDAIIEEANSLFPKFDHRR